MKHILLLLLITLALPSFAWTDRFVVITDSHGVGVFGEVLAKHLRSREDTAYTFFASGGSAPLQWLNNAFTSTCAFKESSELEVPKRECKKLLTPRLSDIWKGIPVDRMENRVTVIVLGTNYSLDPKLKAEQIAATRKLEAAVPGDCIWVGPPNMRRSPGFDAAGVQAKVDIIKSALTRCNFIDSRNFSDYPESGDGIHYHWVGSRNEEQIKAATDWAEAVIRQIELIF